MLFTSSLLSCSPQEPPCATPLIAASIQNHIKVARFLVERGASINYQNKVFDINIFAYNSTFTYHFTIERQLTSSMCMCLWQYGYCQVTDPI